MPLPLPHHVLWFLAAFVSLWAASLIVRGVLHRPGSRIAGRWVRGPRRVKASAVWAGVLVLPAGVGLGFAAEAVRAWIYGPLGLSGGPTAFHAAAVGVGAFGVTLAVRAWRGDRDRRARRCPNCAYDMSDLASAGRLTCPECGFTARSADDLFGDRRRWRLLAVALLILASAFGVPKLAAVRTHGVKTLVPTTVMIAGLWLLPDGWVDSDPRASSRTLRGRADAGDLWEWQRSWLSARARSELKSPTSIQRVRRALTFAPLDPMPIPQECMVYAASRLGAPDAKERVLASWTVSWLNSLTGGLPVDDPRFVAALAAHADDLARGLDDPSIEIVMTAADLLDRAGRHGDRIVTAILKSREPLRDTPRLSQAVRLLLTHGKGSPEVLDALREFSRPGLDHPGRFWYGVMGAGPNAEIPELVLRRADEVLLTDGGEDAIWPAARLRLTGRYASRTLESALALAAELPGPRRAHLLRVLRFHPTAAGRRRHAHLVLEALRSPDPRVLRVALAWIESLRDERALEAFDAAPELRALTLHPDHAIAERANAALESLHAALAADPAR